MTTIMPMIDHISRDMYFYVLAKYVIFYATSSNQENGITTLFMSRESWVSQKDL